MARVELPAALPTPPHDPQPIQAYAHGHASSVGYGHEVVSRGGQTLSRPPPPPSHTVKTASPVPLRTPAAGQGGVSRSRIFPPRRGQASLYSAAEREAMRAAGTQAHLEVRATAVLCRDVRVLFS